MDQALDCELLLYADDSCLVYQYKNVSKINQNLNKHISNICIWFVDNELRVHFGEDKTKSIPFGTQHKLAKVGSLDVRYGTIHIKEYQTVICLGCSLDENLSVDIMAQKVINKINSRIKFLYSVASQTIL